MSDSNQTTDACTCDRAQTKQRTCMNCLKDKTYPKDYSERVSSCPVHRKNIAICGANTRGAICDSCEADGYYLSSTGHWPAATYSIKRRDQE